MFRIKTHADIVQAGESIWFHCSLDALEEEALFGGEQGYEVRMLEHFRTEHPHKGEVAVTLGVIQSVADHKMIRNFESDVVRADRLDAARGLVQQHANFHAARAQLAQFDHDLREGFAGVQYIVHHQDITAADIQAQFLGEDQFSRFGPASVAGNADEIQAQREGKVPEQIRQENNGAVQERDNDQIASGEVLFDLAGQGVDAAGQLLLGNQNKIDFLAPMARRLLDAFRHCMEFKGKAAGGKFKMCAPAPKKG